MDAAMAGWAATDGVDYASFREIIAAWAEPATAEASPMHALERGEITPEEFEHELAAALRARGFSVPRAGLLSRILAGFSHVEDMAALVRQARLLGVRTALLSNSWGEHYPEHLWSGLFDAVVISGRIGMRKPEPRIYRHTAELLDLAPAECVMVDDLPRNVRGAVSAGMVGVQHEAFEQTAVELAALFGWPAPG